MDNIFFASPQQFTPDNKTVTITGQEAQHIAKVLRKREGDEITVANGVGSHFRCIISLITRQHVQANCLEEETRPHPQNQKILALGSLRKRDRLEFAFEKAVELGATELCLFEADHSERSRIKADRLEMVLTSAFKQSGRFWLPKLTMLDSLEQVLLRFSDFEAVMAHEKVEVAQPVIPKNKNVLLLVGPEGGFSDFEVELVEKAGGALISLGENRLRAETAVTALLSLFLFR